MPEVKNGNPRRAPLHSVIDSVGRVNQLPYVCKPFHRCTEERKVPEHLRVIHERKAQFFGCHRVFVHRVFVSDSLDDPLQVR